MRFYCFAVAVLISSILHATAAAQTPDLTQHVDPMVGTQNMGHTFPGATVPFGGVQLSPDTQRLQMYDDQGQYVREAYRYCAGYQYEDTLIHGFSHTHFSGTGHSDLGDISMMPFSDQVDLEDPASWVSGFSHDRETAEPGYYSVYLKDAAVEAELSATLRTGLHRYTFEPGSSMGVVLDLTANIYDYEGKNVWTFVRVENDTLVTGYRQTSGWARTRTVYFALAFDHPISQYSLKRLDATPYGGFYRRFDQEKSFPEMAGKDLRAQFEFESKDGHTLQAKLGISGVSTAGALANLEAESSGWDFDGARQAAHDSWNKELSRVEVEMLNQDQMSIFYTALYHSFLGPVVYEDVDGKYRGLDQNIHPSTEFTNYTIFSLWDTYRALHPLFTLVQTKRNGDMIASMLAHQEQSVHGMLPIWSHYANENWCMIGYHSVPVIADAMVKGQKGFDWKRALEASVETARVPYFDGVGELQKTGYVPDEVSGSSVSITLELAYDDWCVAQMAKKLEEPEMEAEFAGRSRSFEKLFDPEIGFMRPRHRNGEWRQDFNTMSTHGQGFIEGNAWNYGLYVPHDVPRMVELMGGPKRFGAHLDSLFTMEISDEDIAHTEDITRDGIIGNYVHGNEPGHHIAYLYNWSDRPWQTQARVRMIMDSMYGTGPKGLCGNDDAGQMSAWYIFSALGFYPVCPGSTEYSLGSPLVKSAMVNLENGKVLRVRTENQAAGNIYVREVRWNGKQLERLTVDHLDLMEGGELVFSMSSRAPNSGN